jgi:hypothetical protein
MSRAYHSEMSELESSLIDSNAAMPTRAKQVKTVQAERLNTKTSYMDDAIVRSASNKEDAEIGRNDQSPFRWSNNQAFAWHDNTIRPDNQPNQ